MGWWKYAKAGDKVVCVSIPTIENSQNAVLTNLQVGKIYVIQSIEVYEFGDITPIHFDVGTYCQVNRIRELVSAHRFLPLVSKSTDAEVAKLKSLLNVKSRELVE